MQTNNNQQIETQTGTSLHLRQSPRPTPVLQLAILRTRCPRILGQPSTAEQLAKGPALDTVITPFLRQLDAVLPRRLAYNISLHPVREIPARSAGLIRTLTSMHSYAVRHFMYNAQ